MARPYWLMESADGSWKPKLTIMTTLPRTPFQVPHKRNEVMFGPPGRAYIYRSYGIHWCLNFVCQPEGHGAGVLIRAIEPVAGLEIMRARRGLHEERLLCAGPGESARRSALRMRIAECESIHTHFSYQFPRGQSRILTGPRIGITKAADVPWRFGLSGSPFLSRPFPLKFAKTTELAGAVKSFVVGSLELPA